MICGDLVAFVNGYSLEGDGDDTLIGVIQADGGDGNDTIISASTGNFVYWRFSYKQ